MSFESGIMKGADVHSIEKSVGNTLDTSEMPKDTKTLEKTDTLSSYSITDLPPLIVGGAVFNYQYTQTPEASPIYEILDTAFAAGLIAIDTSPYYGPSEELIGKALKQLSKWPRDSYFLCTKAGRIRLNEFDFSRANIRMSVERSLTRLNTDYLDLVYLHDIEFGKAQDILEGLKELKKLKQEGLIRNFGVTGYPVDFLYDICQMAAKNEQIGPVDAILSYCNGCIQNVKLLEYYQKFLDCGVKKIMNGSILSMSMLRSQETHSFHPASNDLKIAVKDVATHLKKTHNIELADLATRFALKKWLFGTIAQTNTGALSWNQATSVVLGVSTVEELKSAIENYWEVKLNAEDDEQKFAEVKELLGPHFNETWESGIEH